MVLRVGQGTLGLELCLETHCSGSETETRQVCLGLGCQGGAGGQSRQGRHLDPDPLRFQESHVLLVVGGLINEHRIHGGVPLIQHVLTTEQLEDGFTRPQRLEVVVLGEEPRPRLLGP